jgi:hypothetical protein
VSTKAIKKGNILLTNCYYYIFKIIGPSINYIRGEFYK